MKYLLSLLLVFSLATQVTAQDLPETFKRKHGTFFHLLEPEADNFVFSYVYNPGQEEDKGPGEYDFHELNADFSFPVPFTEDSFYEAGFIYQGRFYDFTVQDGVSPEVSSETLHKVKLSFGVGSFLTDNFLVTANVAPGVYSDFEKTPDDEAFQLFGGGRLIYQINPGTQLLAGVEVGKQFSGADFFPVLGVRIMSGDGKLHVNLTLPLEARIAYNLTPNLQLYGGGWISGDEFRASLGSGSSEQDVYVQDSRFGGGALYWFNDAVNVGLELGANVDSEFQLKARGQDQFQEGDMKTGPYGLLRLGFSL